MIREPDPLLALSPLDGRYRQAAAPLADHLSEFALIRYRLRVEACYLIALADVQEVAFVRAFSPDEIDFLRGLYTGFTLEAARRIKDIEAGTRHDVKAVELYLAAQFAGTSLDGLQSAVHFALTSDDVNNLAYGLAIREGVAVLLTALEAVLLPLWTMAHQHAALPMLARTHGQPATPTTLGKELAVFAARLQGEAAALRLLRDRIPGKLTGATGTFGAHVAAYPNVDWPAFSENFVRGLGLEPVLLTTQVLPPDGIIALFDALRRINVILIDFAQDTWRYISDGYFVQAVHAGEVGSSTMPHKVNPIRFENAEGNLIIANALLEAFARKLPVSRLQRDLSGSTVWRNVGAAFGHCLLAYVNLQGGLGRIVPDEARLLADLRAHPEVITEAIQTILRREGMADAYDRLKAISRGERLTLDDVRAFVNTLALSDAVKAELLALTPERYTGLAARLAGE